MSILNQRLVYKDLNLFRQHAFHPADDIEGYHGEQTSEAKTTMKTFEGTYKFGIIQRKLAKIIPAFRPKSTTRFTNTIGYNQMAVGKKIAKVNLRRRGGDSCGNEGADTVDVTGTYDMGRPGVPAYFLPWDCAGAIVSMKIPQQGSLGRGAEDPDIFFTAAINGCSIFIRGEPISPTVYHAGGDTGRGNDMDRSAAFWREVLANFAHLSDGRFVTEVNKKDYIKTPGQLATDGKLTTANAKAYQAWLENKYKNILNIQLVNPWGCVFGFRNNSLWKFYLQENATIVYLTVNKNRGVQGTKMQIVSRPMVVREIYPGNAVMVNMTTAQPITVSSS